MSRGVSLLPLSLRLVRVENSWLDKECLDGKRVTPTIVTRQTFTWKLIGLPNADNRMCRSIILVHNSDSGNFLACWILLATLSSPLSIALKVHRYFHEKIRRWVFLILLSYLFTGRMKFNLRG